MDDSTRLQCLREAWQSWGANGSLSVYVRHMDDHFGIRIEDYAVGAATLSEAIDASEALLKKTIRERQEDHNKRSERALSALSCSSETELKDLIERKRKEFFKSIGLPEAF